MDYGSGGLSYGAAATRAENFETAVTAGVTAVLMLMLLMLLMCVFFIHKALPLLERELTRCEMQRIPCGEPTCLTLAELRAERREQRRLQNEQLESRCDEGVV